MRVVCGWCGREFEGKTRRATYCSARCKQAHWRAVHNGTRLVLPTEPPAFKPHKLAADEVAQAVVGLRSSLAVLDVAVRKGPEDLRELCALLAARVASALEEVGL